MNLRIFGNTVYAIPEMAAQTIQLTKYEGELPKAKHPEFFASVIRGSTDAELAIEFGLRERTATNYRLRAEEKARELGIRIPERKKGAAASDDHAHDQS